MAGVVVWSLLLVVFRRADSRPLFVFALAWNREFHGRWPGIRLPPARTAEEAWFPDEAEVLGVCTGGQARAYLVSAMSGGPEKHVVNDVLGGRPVSVTYCDRTRCARVFTSDDAAGPLDLDAGGWVHGGLALQIAGIEYAQTTGERLAPEGGPGLPYPALPFERTTWGAWRSAHPDTDLFAGGAAPAEH
jgi:hypothetical protein